MFLRYGSVLLSFWLMAGSVVAAPEFVLKVHHFLPTTSTTHGLFLLPLAKRIEEASQGRLKLEVYSSMQLGGKAPQLYDQVRDGIVDIVWTLPGYTAGRFPKSEVFELPFVPAPSAEVTSQAAQAFAEKYLRDEFGDVEVLMLHVHGAGSFHLVADKNVKDFSDLKGFKIRAPTRMSNLYLNALGITPVGLPAPAVPEALSRGVIDGALLPFEVIASLRVHELTKSHLTVETGRGLYTATFLLAMNKGKFAGLPADLQQVIREQTGLKLAREIGRLWDVREAEGKQLAQARGNELYRVSGEEAQRWEAAAEGVVAQWVTEMGDKGVDGGLLLREARALVAQFAAGADKLP